MEYHKMSKEELAKIVLKKISFKKLKESSKKTILMDNVKVKDFMPKYNDIELLETYEIGGLNSLRMWPGIIPFEKLKEKYGDREILSIHNYEDTKTTSICLRREK